MAEPGLAGAKLQDGICIADRIVRAPLHDVVGLFGDPILVARDGHTVVEAPPEGITMFVASSEDWTIIEPADSTMLGSDDEDYLAPLFDQGIAALEGRIPDESIFIYEHPLATAAYVARELQVDGIALWGSDEHIGICGGAVIAATGEITLAYSEFSADEIRRCAASRAASMEGDDEEDDLDDLLDDDRRVAYCFEPGRGEFAIEGGDAMDLLDTMLKERNAAQPFDPITLWGMWPPDGEVWAAR